MTAGWGGTGWHEGALAGFDLETTGPDPEAARIVTAAVVTRGGGREPDTAVWLVNPGIDIPAEAAEIHGITTEIARERGVDPATAIGEIADRLAAIAAEDVPLVIYNAPFDLTVLDREMRRHGFPGAFVPDLCTRVTVVDPYVLDKHADRFRKGKRTLTACCEHYGVKLDGAHDSAADAVGAMRAAWKIAVTFPEIGAMQPDELHELQVKAKAEQSASFQDYLRRQGKDEVIDGSWPWIPAADLGGNL